MYLFLENSANTEDPLFIKLPNSSAHNSYLDKQLVLFPEISVAKWFYESGIAERNLINWVTENFIQSDKNFVDIGAHVGTYSWICGKKALHTFAFECDPKTFCYLAANVALHELEDKITLFPVALGENRCTTELYRRSKDGGGNGIKLLSDKDSGLQKVKVLVETLDSYNLDNISLIKIDVEGNEIEVLKGAVETLQREKPKILFESWGAWKEQEGVPANKIRSELFAYLESVNYVVKTINGYPDMFLAEYKF